MLEETLTEVFPEPEGGLLCAMLAWMPISRIPPSVQEVRAEKTLCPSGISGKGHQTIALPLISRVFLLRVQRGIR